MTQQRSARLLSLLLCVIGLLSLTACAPREKNVPEPPDYGDPACWAYAETMETTKSADVFFIAPSAYGGKAGAYNMELSVEKTKANFLGATNMEKGIYDGDARFFAPYYRQVGYTIYDLPAKKTEPYFQIAFQDVVAAFDYYMEHYNQGRPLILAGFSQGADMAVRLMKERFAEESLQDQLVACYAIGWRVTQEELDEYPQLRMAQGEDDTGVIITFNTEAEDVEDSLFLPKGTHTSAINPLNWKTDETPANKSLNLGACFTDYGGNILREIPALTGAYLDPVRGALKAPDIDPAEYSATLSILAPGVYHLYDYQFFYRNLEQNVRTRINAYQGL